jgi:hypothetical protein
MADIFAHFNQIWSSLTDFRRSPNKKFHENPSSGSRADMCGQPDMMRPTETSRDLGERA